MNENFDVEARRRTAELYTKLDERFRETATANFVRFMNFGYRPLAGEDWLGPTVSPLFPNRDSLQMVMQVVGGAVEAKSDVVEIGSGRGGNLWALATFMSVKHCVGVDITMTSLRHAAEDSPLDYPQFVVGDAQTVPLRDRSADLVLSIETSCHYPNIELFYREVSRVCRVGGQFAYADLMPVEVIGPIREALTRLGFDVTELRDISANVMASRSARGRKAARAVAGRGAAESEAGSVAREWTGAEGSLIFDAIASGTLQYFLCRAVRRDASPQEEPVLDPGIAALMRSGALLGNDLLNFDGV